MLYVRFHRDFLNAESSRAATAITRALNGDSSWVPATYPELLVKLDLTLDDSLEQALGTDPSVIAYDEDNAEFVFESARDMFRVLVSNAGRAGGRASSAAKTKAARENAKKGGRPTTYTVETSTSTLNFPTITEARRWIETSDLRGHVEIRTKSGKLVGLHSLDPSTGRWYKADTGS